MAMALDNNVRRHLCYWSSYGTERRWWSTEHASVWRAMTNWGQLGEQWCEGALTVSVPGHTGGLCLGRVLPPSEDMPNIQGVILVEVANAEFPLPCVARSHVVFTTVQAKSNMCAISVLIVSFSVDKDTHRCWVDSLARVGFAYCVGQLFSNPSCSYLFLEGSSFFY